MGTFSRKHGILLIILCLILLSFCGCGTKKSHEEQMQKGFVNGVQLGSSSVEQVISILGKPDERTVTTSGRVHLTYGTLTPSSEWIKYSFLNNDQPLKMIGTRSKNNTICGVRVGMSFLDAKKILGESTLDQVGADTNDFNGWLVEYVRGRNHLLLSSKTKNDPIKQILFFQVSKETEEDLNRLENR